jgi:hypothetical protein
MSRAQRAWAREFAGADLLSALQEFCDISDRAYILHVDALRSCAPQRLFGSPTTLMGKPIPDGEGGTVRFSLDRLNCSTSSS